MIHSKRNHRSWQDLLCWDTSGGDGQWASWSYCGSCRGGSTGAGTCCGWSGQWASWSHTRTKGTTDPTKPVQGCKLQGSLWILPWWGFPGVAVDPEVMGAPAEGVAVVGAPVVGMADGLPGVVMGPAVATLPPVGVAAVGVVDGLPGVAMGPAGGRWASWSHNGASRDGSTSTITCCAGGNSDTL